MLINGFFVKRRAALEIVFHGAPVKEHGGVVRVCRLDIWVYLTATAPLLRNRLIQSRYVA